MGERRAGGKPRQVTSGSKSTRERPEWKKEGGHS